MTNSKLDNLRVHSISGMAKLLMESLIPLGSKSSQARSMAWFSCVQFHKVLPHTIASTRIQIAADCDTSLPDTELTVFSLLGTSIRQVLKVYGGVRPGHEKGREHFGYMDGISLPAVRDIVSPHRGQLVVDPGVILLGQEGDPRKAQRPSWAKNGSFLVYRHLDQLVPEFDLFKRKNALRVKDIGVEKGADLLGSRFFGRWKDGEPSCRTTLYVVSTGRTPRYSYRHISHRREPHNSKGPWAKQLFWFFKRKPPDYCVSVLIHEDFTKFTA